MANYTLFRKQMIMQLGKYLSRKVTYHTNTFSDMNLKNNNVEGPWILFITCFTLEMGIEVPISTLGLHVVS